MFKQANQLKLRFNTAKGSITVEDLFDLPLTSKNNVSLDGLAIATNQELQASKQESFVEAASTGSTILQLKLDILKEVIADRIADNAKLLAAKENKAYKDKLLSILAAKEDEDLHSKSPEEIKKLLAEVEAA